jgi:hypothetical protein
MSPLSTKFLGLWLFGIYAICLRTATAQEAVPSGAAAAAPTINVLSYTEYPSMLPVTAIRVHFGLAIHDVVDSAIAAKWDCAKTTSYTVAIGGTKTHIAIANLRLEGGAGGATACSVGLVAQPDVILVLKDNTLNTNDKLTVSLANLPAGLAATSSAAVAVPKSLNSVAITITPQAAPGEALTDGAKRDVGQLNIAFTAPEIAPKFALGAVYLNSADTFSTDERDSKSAFAATIGFKRGLTSRWYTPFSVQETMQGNQDATSLSAVTALALSSIMPWSWNRRVLYNGAMQAPNPPEFTLNASYTRRIEQSVTKATPLLAVNDFSLNPSATFTPIYLLPATCTWLQKKLSKAGAAASTSRQYCLALQTDLGMWYLPLDTTKSGSQRAEGYGDISILIPLSDIPFVSKSISNLITGNTSNNQLSIKYSDSVNPANNYARTKQWTYGFAVIK